MNQKLTVGIVYVVILFMAIMDSTIVNVALPTLGREFHTSSDGADGVVIAYLVSLAVFIPTSGWLGDRLGGRTVLLGSITVFTVSSALCGSSSSLGELVGFRIVQGVGGGLMTPVGLAMLWRVFPPAERVKASSILIIPTALAPALGPVLGGLFVSELSWRWVFFVNVPIGAAALVFGVLFLREQRLEASGGFDVPGFLLAGFGLALVMYGLSEGPMRGWTNPAILASCVAGAVLLGTLTMVELRRTRPLLDLRLLHDRLFSLSNGVMFLGSIAFLGTLYVVSLFFQDGLGLNALRTGLSIFPEAIGVMAGTQLIGRYLYPVFGPRRVMCGGLVLAACAMASLLAIGPTSTLWWARLVLFVMGLGMSGVFIPNQTAAFATISSASMGDASTLYSTQSQLGAAAGVAILTTILAGELPFVRHSGHLVANLTSYRASFVAAAGFALAGALLSLCINDGDAAATITRWRGRDRSPTRPSTTSGGLSDPRGRVLRELPRR
ncbi:MAG: DHA2 family efflux MFS transporter permease subunit [Acidimicrobiales bacterium]